MKSRILWLIQNDTVYQSDAIELIDADFDIYFPKKISWENRSKGLFNFQSKKEAFSIDNNDLTALETIDFWHVISDDQWDRINNLFQYVFIDYYPTQFETFLKKFKGTIIFRPTIIPKSSFGNHLLINNGLTIFNYIDQVGKRFWFAPVFYNEAENESNILKRRFIKLPLLINNINLDQKNLEIDKEKVLIALPEINTLEGQDIIYRNTVDYFRNNKVDYLICGEQFLDTSYNPAILGNLTQLELEELFKSVLCLFIPENVKGNYIDILFLAIKNNIPVIFPENNPNFSLWKILLQDADLINLPAGSYSTIESAEIKINKLKEGNSDLYLKILNEQKVFFAESNIKWRKEVFQKSWQIIVNQHNNYLPKNNEIFYLGIILPTSYSLEIIEQLHELIIAIKKSIKNDEIKIIVGYPDIIEYKDHTKELLSIEKEGVPLRKYSFRIVDNIWLRDMLSMKGYPVYEEFYSSFYILNDDSTYFEDFNTIIFFESIRSIELNGFNKILTTKPYIIYCLDGLLFTEYIQRNYINMEMFRHAQNILCQNRAIEQYILNNFCIPNSKIRNIGSMVPENQTKQQDAITISDNYFLYFSSGLDSSMDNIEKTLFQYYNTNGDTDACVICIKDNNEIILTLINKNSFVEAKKYNSNAFNYNKISDYMNNYGIPITSTIIESLIRQCKFTVITEYIDLYYSFIVKLTDNKKKIICPNIFGLKNILGLEKYIISIESNDIDSITKRMLEIDEEKENLLQQSSESIFPRGDLEMIYHSIRECIL